MNRLRRILIMLAVVALTLAGSSSAQACSACFGKSNDKMLTAYYIGAIILVGFITAVLGAITTFFVYLARRSARTAAQDQAAAQLSATH